MLTYEQQTEKLEKRKFDLTARIATEQAELDRINAKLSAMQLAKVREALDMQKKDFFEMLNQHPDQLKSLLKRSTHRPSPEVKSDSVPNADSKSDTNGNQYQKSFT